MGTGCIKASMTPVIACMSQLDPLMLKGCSFLWSQLICNGLETLFSPGFFSWPYLQHWSSETITGTVKYWRSLAPKGLFLVILVSWKWEGQMPSHRVPVNEWRLVWPQKLRTFVVPSQRRDKGRVCCLSYPSSACTKKDGEGEVNWVSWLSQRIRTQLDWWDCFSGLQIDWGSRWLRTRAAAHNTSNWKALSVSSGQKLTWLDKEQSWLGGKGFYKEIVGFSGNLQNSLSILSVDQSLAGNTALEKENAIAYATSAPAAQTLRLSGRCSAVNLTPFPTKTHSIAGSQCLIKVRGFNMSLRSRVSQKLYKGHQGFSTVEDNYTNWLKLTSKRWRLSMPYSSP